MDTTEDTNHRPEGSRPFLTPAEVAASLGISRSLVYRLADEGVLKAITIGRVRRITRRSLDDYTSELLDGATAEPDAQRDDADVQFDPHAAEGDARDEHTPELLGTAKANSDACHD